LVNDSPLFIQTGEPTIEVFQHFQKVLQKHDSDYLIAIGGGSVIDLVKLLKKDIHIPMVAIPTTIGSGAEVSQYSLLIGANSKQVTASSLLLPEVVIINPNFFKSLSREQIIYQSIDALSHAIESLVSRSANHLSDTLALSSLNDLYTQLTELSDNVAMTDSLLERIKISSTLAGLAQSSAATGLVHAFAHYFGAHNGIAHAQAISVFLLDVLALNAQHTDRYQKLNGLKNLSEKKFISKLDLLLHKLNVPLPKVALHESIEIAAKKIKADICTITNPWSPDIADIIAIIKQRT